MSASARSDFNDAFADAVSYRLGVTTNARLRWFANVGRGVKNPTFTERFGFAPDAFIGNPDLEPETSTGFEIGLARAWEEASFTLVYFDASLDDEIDGFAFDADLDSLRHPNPRT